MENGGDKAVSELVLVELASILSIYESPRSELAGKNTHQRLITNTHHHSVHTQEIQAKASQGRWTAQTTVSRRAKQAMSIALSLSPKIKLKTLDLLHVAYACLIRIDGRKLEKIITADRDFESVAIS